MELEVLLQEIVCQHYIVTIMRRDLGMYDATLVKRKSFPKTIVLKSKAPSINEAIQRAWKQRKEQHG